MAGYVNEDRLFHGLVELYAEGGIKTEAVIAKLCDEHLDRSGGLLGRVRDAAMEKRELLVAARRREL